MLVVMMLLDEEREREASVYLAFHQEFHHHRVFAFIWDPLGPGKNPGISSTTVNTGDAADDCRTMRGVVHRDMAKMTIRIKYGGV